MRREAEVPFPQDFDFFISQRVPRLILYYAIYFRLILLKAPHNFEESERQKKNFYEGRTTVPGKMFLNSNKNNLNAYKNIFFKWTKMELQVPTNQVILIIND